MVWLLAWFSVGDKFVTCWCDVQLPSVGFKTKTFHQTVRATSLLHRRQGQHHVDYLTVQHDAGLDLHDLHDLDIDLDLDLHLDLDLCVVVKVSITSTTSLSSTTQALTFTTSSYSPAMTSPTGTPYVRCRHRPTTNCASTPCHVTSTSSPRRSSSARSTTARRRGGSLRVTPSRARRATPVNCDPRMRAVKAELTSACL